MRLWYTQNNNNDNNNNNNNNNNKNTIIIIFIIIIVIKVIVVVMLTKRITIIIIITSILTWATLPASLLCFKVISISPAATINEHPALIGSLIIVKSCLAGPTGSFNWRKGTEATQDSRAYFGPWSCWHGCRSWCQLNTSPSARAYCCGC